MTLKILLALFIGCFSQVALAGNYILTIGENSYEISLEQDMSIVVDGKEVAVRLVQKDILTYQTDNFSYDYPSKYSPSKSDLGGGTFQTALTTSLGSIFLVQEYLSMNPTALTDLMVNEITKEEREYGYTIETSDATVTLSDGNVLNGKYVTSRYKGSDIERYVYTYGVKDSGLLILTQVDYEVEPDAGDLIQSIINTLTVTME